MLCLICPHSPSGAARFWARAYISGKALVPVLQLLRTYICIRICIYIYIVSSNLLRRKRFDDLNNLMNNLMTQYSKPVHIFHCQYKSSQPARGIYTCTYTHIAIHTYIYIYIATYIHPYIYIYIQMHMP